MPPQGKGSSRAVRKKMKSVNESWDNFILTLSAHDGEGVLTQVKCPLLELMDKQVNIDKARKILFKPEFGQLLKLYLGRMDLHELSDKMTNHEKNFVRAFGIDKYNHLKLLVKLKMIIEEQRPKKGLLSGDIKWQQELKRA